MQHFFLILNDRQFWLIENLLSFSRDFIFCCWQVDLYFYENSHSHVKAEKIYCSLS
jgi:hypothetical protein